MANPNIVTTSSIYGRTDVLAVTTSLTAITSNGSSSGKVYRINSLIVSNVNGASAVDVSVELQRSGVSYHLAKTLSIAADSTASVVGKSNPLYLLEGDSLWLVASANSAAEAICSYEEIG